MYIVYTTYVMYVRMNFIVNIAHFIEWRLFIKSELTLFYGLPHLYTHVKVYTID